jgi:hypothetical protein
MGRQASERPLRQQRERAQLLEEVRDFVRSKPRTLHEIAENFRWTAPVAARYLKKFPMTFKETRNTNEWSLATERNPQ